MRTPPLVLPLAALVALTASSSAWASYAFYVGKNLTATGGVIVGGTGEEVSSHWLEIVPAREHPADATVEVGVTGEARIPGELIEIPQASRTHRYLSMSYSDFAGFPAPLTNGGINEHQVAVRDVWAPNRSELVEMTPTPQRGVQYSDLARIVLERAETAREGVELIGELIAEHGYATYGGNTHLIADPEEGWVVWEFAGGEGLWAAERLGPDDVRVLYPGYIEAFPVDFDNDPDFMGADHLVDFAVEQGWWDPDAGEPFNVFEVYGDQEREARTGGFKYMTQAELEAELEAMVPVSEQDMIARVRDPRIADDEAGYGQVASLEAGIDPALVQIWVAPTGSVAAPFVPWWLGVREVPMAYGQHRYLTKDAAATFLDPDFQIQEASDFVGRRFKQVMYYTCADPETYLPAVTAMLEGFEDASFGDLGWVEDAAATLLASEERAAAEALLTHYATTRAQDALELGEAMKDWLAAHVTLAGAPQRPEGSEINSQGGETVNCLVGADPDRPRAAQ
ncbi:MAG: C69 family dipeptidase [Alphaproteobacteria bacterium]